MTHPDHLLADYVDGTLTEQERAVVDAHLGSCETCREEIEASRTALRALATLEDVPVPVGVTGRVISEARAETDRRASRWGRVQWAAGLAAAAAIVAVIAVNVSGPSGGDADRASAPAAEGGTAVEQAMAASGVQLERQRGVNYDGDAGIEALAEEAFAGYAAGGDDGPTESAGDAGGSEEAPVPGAGGETADTSTRSAAAALSGEDLVDPAPALRCFETAGIPPADSPPVTLVRLLEARYSRTPAYIAVFLQGPGAAQEPDRVVVWTVDRETCTLLNAVDVPFSRLAG